MSLDATLQKYHKTSGIEQKLYYLSVEMKINGGQIITI